MNAHRVSMFAAIQAKVSASRVRFCGNYSCSKIFAVPRFTGSLLLNQTRAASLETQAATIVSEQARIRLCRFAHANAS